MHLAVFALVLYVMFAEWRLLTLKNRLGVCEKQLSKFKKDKTVWYTGVLPKADKLCLFEEKNGDYRVSKLEDKYWQNKDGTVDFSKIKRWVYIEDMNNL